MKIAMISSEIAPYAKSGGLADVVRTLSAALARQEHTLSLVMPAYSSVLQSNIKFPELVAVASVPVSNRQEQASVVAVRAGERIRFSFVRSDKYFDREGLYGTPSGDYSDNAERFTFFSRAALELLRLDPPEIIHCHDWQTALAVVFLNAQPNRYPELAEARTVFTIHNIGFQGVFWAPDWHLLDLDGRFFTPEYLEFYGSINFLKGALVFADRLTTVSPSYAREIAGSEQGFGLEGVLARRARELVGILNGVDYEEWNPAIDRWIAKRYDSANLAGKRTCKQHLLQSMGLAYQPETPLIGMVSRLTAQKGFDLVEQALDRLMERRVQMVLLGSGEPRYEMFFKKAAERFPARFAARIGFDEALAHQIEAGADIFLMPSLYEPCGLNQMFSLKYGTIPIVRAVGGLQDTVEDYNPQTSTGTGFLFRNYDPETLLQAIDRALELFQDSKRWTTLRRRAMEMDFSWDRSAQAYSRLYEELVSGPPRARSL
jgi:starch synthase